MYLFKKMKVTIRKTDYVVELLNIQKKRKNSKCIFIDLTKAKHRTRGKYTVIPKNSRRTS